MVISCSATRALLEASESKGLDVDALIAGCGHTAAFLRNPRNRVDWETFAALNDRVAALCEGRLSLFELGAAMSEVPGYEFARALTGCMLTPTQFYRFLHRWIGPAQFPNIVATMVECEDGRLKLTLDLAEGDRPSNAFHQISAGAMAQIPTLLGYGPAEVTLSAAGQRAEFTITPPRTLPIFNRLRQIARTVFGGPAALRELVHQQEILKESYEALLRTRQDFRQVIETMSDAVMIHRDGTVLWANRTLLEPFGYACAQEIVGRSVLDFVHPDDRVAVRARLGGPIDARSSPMDCRLLARNGTVKTLEIAPAQEIHFEGAKARLIVGRDRTERKCFQDQLMLADRMATVGVLAAGVAHEINNPLTYVCANIELARAAADELGEDGRDIAEALTAATEGVERVTAIVRDLKMLSRGDAPRRDAPSSDHGDLVAVDVRAVVQSALAVAKKQLARKARVVVEPGPRLAARASRSRLGQVILNLLLNAAEAITDVDPAAHEIRVGFASHDGAVVISVHDTGPGIPKAILGRIFDPFFTTKSPGEGTGLGLSICHRIVTDFGGTITASSKPGDGTTFHVSLVAASLADISGSTPRPAPPSARRARLLVVDDEPLLRNVLRTVLEESHDVVLAGEGAQALDLLLSDTKFDLVLCDLMMADVTGMDVYEAVRTQRPGLEKRLVFMTGGAFTARGREFLASVPNRCLEKPFDAGEVFAVVNEHLARDPRDA